MPGIVKFIKASDIPGTNNFLPEAQGYQPEEILCSGQVLYAGQAVGLVVAGEWLGYLENNTYQAN